MLKKVLLCAVIVSGLTFGAHSATQVQDPLAARALANLAAVKQANSVTIVGAARLFVEIEGERIVLIGAPEQPMEYGFEFPAPQPN